MPLYQSEIPWIETSQKVDVSPWQNLQEVLYSQQDRLRKIRDKEGLKAAHREQEKMLKGMKDREPWDWMFALGLLRNPEAYKLIGDTRKVFDKLVSPLPNSEEEQLGALREMNRRLVAILRKIRGESKDIHNERTPEGSDLDLKQVFKLIEAATSLARRCPEADLLIQNMTEVIDEIARREKGEIK